MVLREWNFDLRVCHVCIYNYFINSFINHNYRRNYMASPRGKSTSGGQKIGITVKKVTTIGHSDRTRYKSKNDKRNKKRYRGQG